MTKRRKPAAATPDLDAIPEKRLLSVHESELLRKAPGSYTLDLSAEPVEKRMKLMVAAPRTIH